MTVGKSTGLTDDVCNLRRVGIISLAWDEYFRNWSWSLRADRLLPTKVPGITRVDSNVYAGIHLQWLYRGLGVKEMIEIKSRNNDNSPGSPLPVWSILKGAGWCWRVYLLICLVGLLGLGALCGVVQSMASMIEYVPCPAYLVKALDWFFFFFFFPERIACVHGHWLKYGILLRMDGGVNRNIKFPNAAYFLFGNDSTHTWLWTSRPSHFSLLTLTLTNPHSSAGNTTKNRTSPSPWSLFTFKKSFPSMALNK